jgi:hypothetical protein
LSETGFFYENTQVAARRFGKKPGFFGWDAQSDNVIFSRIFSAARVSRKNLQ